jgi:tRNA(Ile)-lysidine synthase
MANLARVSSEQLTLIDDTLEAAYTGYLKAGHDSVIISHPGLDGNIPAIRYLVSRELGERFGLNVSSRVLDEIIRNYSRLRSNNVLYNRNGVIVRKRHRAGGNEIVICRTCESAGCDSEWKYIINIDSGVKTVVAEACISLEVEETDFKSFCADGSGASSIFLSVEPQVKSVTARIRMPGDRIKLAKGTRKIKDLLIEKKLDSDMKKKIPIITVEGRVAACLTGIIPGSFNRVSCNFSVRNDSKRIIRVNIEVENDI